LLYRTLFVKMCPFCKMLFSFYKELVHSVEKLQQSARLVAYILNFNLIYTPVTNSLGIQRKVFPPHSVDFGHSTFLLFGNLYILLSINHSSSVKKVKLSWLWLFSCSKNHQFSSRYVKIRYQYDVDSSLWMDANSFFFTNSTTKFKKQINFLRKTFQ
jgi:hypothetical protein